MKAIPCEPGQKKAISIIERSAEVENSVIVCPTSAQQKYLNKLAKRYNITSPITITPEEIINGDSKDFMNADVILSYDSEAVASAFIQLIRRKQQKEKFKEPDSISSRKGIL